MRNFKVNRRRPAGLTLAETVVALFVLLSCIAIFLTFMRSLLGEGRRARQQTLATAAAESRLAQVEALVYQMGPNFYQNAAWAAISGLPASDPAFPLINFAQQVDLLSVAAPCGALEATQSQPRLMTESFRQVEVRARWGWRPQDEVVLIRRFAGPCSTNPTLRVEPLAVPPNPLPRNASANFRASLVDPNGRPIPDVSFGWFVEVVTGSADVRASGDRMGRQGTLTHQIRMLDGSLAPGSPDPFSASPRRCRVKVKCHYHGQDIWGMSDEISLAN
ncbi:hypothetical protein IV102_37085 [bacterium]|nr:hypothetical protein [bacterium]